MNEAQSGPRVLNPFEFIGGGQTHPEGATKTFAQFVAERGEPRAEDDTADEAHEGSVHPSLLGDVPDLDDDDGE